MLEFKNDEFSFTRTNVELKGYLYQTNNIISVKSKVDAVLEKIKNNKNLGNGENEIHYEETLQNISEEFNDLITQLTKEQEKPISIFYNIHAHSFLNGKHKYYSVYINDDIIPGEKGVTHIKLDDENINVYDDIPKKWIRKNINYNNNKINNYQKYIQNKSIKDDADLQEINEIEENIYNLNQNNSNKDKSSEPSNIEQKKRESKEKIIDDENNINKELNQDQAEQD